MQYTERKSLGLRHGLTTRSVNLDERDDDYNFIEKKQQKFEVMI
jgi:hypothetical protein